MKFLVSLTITIAVCSAGVIEDPTAGYKEGDRFFYFPGDGDGIHHLIDTEEPVDFDFINGYTTSSNVYSLYTWNNPTEAQVLRFGDEQSIWNSNFQTWKNTIFSIHGWNGNSENSMNTNITKAFLDNGDVNVIVVGWEEMASKNYVTARYGVANVGKILGQFITWLTTLGLPYDNVHIIGFSLGGHVAGNAGTETKGLSARITSLDPAGPLFLRWDNDRVKSSGALYVEIIHTNSAFFGYRDPCGHADFYPNGGSHMPGCSSYSCSHSRAYEYMASSVRYNHLNANECGSQSDAENNRCTGPLNPMGNSDLTKSWPGIFRGNTGNEYPF